jgi:hypothetical protein
MYKNVDDVPSKSNNVIGIMYRQIGCHCNALVVYSDNLGGSSFVLVDDIFRSNLLKSIIQSR